MGEAHLIARKLGRHGGELVEREAPRIDRRLEFLPFGHEVFCLPGLRRDRPGGFVEMIDLDFFVAKVASEQHRQQEVGGKTRKRNDSQLSGPPAPRASPESSRGSDFHGD